MRYFHAVMRRGKPYVTREPADGITFFNQVSASLFGHNRKRCFMNATRNQPKPQQPPQQKPNEKENGNGQPKRPFAELKRFPLKTVIWENQTVNGAMFSVQLVRVYKDEDNNWQETHSFNADDLLAAVSS